MRRRLGIVWVTGLISVLAQQAPVSAIPPACDAAIGPGPSLVRDVNRDPRGSDSIGFTRLGQRMLFAADDGIHGEELWRAASDGRVTMVMDLRPGAAASYPQDF